MIQARREIEQEWSAQRILDSVNQKKEQPDNIVARQEARQRAQKIKWINEKERAQREQERKFQQEQTFKPRTNNKSKALYMQKSMRDQLMAQNQPSKIDQVFSTGLSAENGGDLLGASNPFTTVQRLYESHEKKQVKQAILDEQLFSQKYSFHPTVYSQCPPMRESPYLSTLGAENVQEFMMEDEQQA